MSNLPIFETILIIYFGVLIAGWFARLFYAVHRDIKSGTGHAQLMDLARRAQNPNMHCD